jgi:SAM-dependent methyltransferase
VDVTEPLPEHVAENRREWDADAPNWVADGERNWAQTEPTWGMWNIPQSELPLLPDDMSGLEAVELGCGTGYISAWMARRGAAVTGIDNSEGQLATARRLADQHQLDITWIHGNAEAVPRPDGSFDFAISEYGAVLWCDPYVWVPEAHRLLRPGGRLVTLSTSSLAHACMPVDGSLPCRDTLQRPSFGMHRFDWREAVDEPGGIEFNLTVSDWFHLFKDTGFAVDDFTEVRAPVRGPEVRFFATADWSNDHPSEQVWMLTRL